MSEEVWWAKQYSAFVDMYRSRKDAERGGYPVRSVSLYDWERQFDGPIMKPGEIIAIRPLRIEVVKEGGVMAIYHAMRTVGTVDDLHWRIARDWDLLTHEEVARLLNAQAERIEVLREWILDEIQFPDVQYEQVMIQRSRNAERVELAKRRIAALEGESQPKKPIPG